MERYLGPMWSAMPIAKPDSKRLRKKLQKAGTQQSSYSTTPNESKTTIASLENKVAAVPVVKKPPPASQNPISTAPAAPAAVPLNNPPPSKRLTSRAAKHASLPLPRTPSYDKWLNEFKESGYLYRGSQPTQGKPKMAATSVIPEFAHLAISQPSHSQERSPSFPPRPNRNPARISRKYAKTPVSRIGQLEDEQPGGRSQETLRPIPSIERIAESYRALLESRNSFLSDSTVEESFFSSELGDDLDYIKNVIIFPPVLEPVVEMPEPLPIARGSPKSDEATLVSFEDNASYFKNVRSVSSRSSYETALPGTRGERITTSAATPASPTTPQDNPSLQICFDLLTRELASAVSGSTNHVNDQTSALQIWVMIEAYEKLRDQLLRERGVSNGEKMTLAATLGTWIKGLHAVHDQMTGGDGARSESYYGD
ncbi:hypothetical protein F5Y16DRAFT_400095 [Xylariaceae sp. FL0255]|nr:hypothetical protein F5Y16DRAFT_400095 [Xylariaceae sp. FL0255]